MKIIIINRFFCEYSAGETLSFEMFSYLKGLGHDVYFFATDKKPYYIENYEYSKYFPKDTFSTIEYLKNPISYYWDFEAQRKLEQLILDIKPDIIHCNQPITYSIFSTIKKHNIPLVWTLHDSAIYCPSALVTGKTKRCEKFLCKNGNYIHCLLNNCKRNLETSLRKTILCYVNRFFAQYSAIDAFICPSEALKEKVLETNLKISRSKIHVLNNFIKVNEKPQISDLSESQEYFLYVGRLVGEKGIQDIIKAAYSLPKDIPFVIAGKGQDENYLKELVFKHGLDNIKFVGYVPQDKINELYAKAIAIIVPSICYEVFGMINIEAALQYKPVIATRIGGIPEIVEHDNTGLLFDVGNIEQLKECIFKYWNNKELASKHGINAYEKAKSSYDENKYFNDLLKLYGEIINGL